MATAIKKTLPKPGKPAGKRTDRLKPTKRVKPVDDFDPVADAQECRKISQTIDPEAFLRFHNHNQANAAYWQTKE